MARLWSPLALADMLLHVQALTFSAGH